MSPPLCKDCKHGFAVAAIDAVQLAVIGPANKTNSGILHFILSCVDFSLYGVASGSTLVIFVFWLFCVVLFSLRHLLINIVSA